MKYIQYKNGLAEFRRKVSHFGLGGILGLVGMGYFYNHGGVYLDGLGGLVDDGMKRGYIDRNGAVVIDRRTIMYTLWKSMVPWFVMKVN